MNGIPASAESFHPPMLTGGVMGLMRGEIEEAMSAYFTLKRTTFRESPAWCLEQSSGPELLPFAVHHKKVRHALTYAQQVAGLMRCVVVLDGRHCVVCPARGVPESSRSLRS